MFKYTVFISLIIFSLCATAQVPPPLTVSAKLQDGSGSTISSTAHALDINLKTSAVSFWQSIQPVSGTLTCNAGSGTLAVSGPLTDTQLRATAVPVSISGSVTATNSANGATGSAVPAQATQVGGSDGTNLRAIKVSSTGVVSVDGSAVTQPVSAASLPLPTGAATNSELITINSTLGSPFQSGGSIGNSSFGISGTLPAFGSTPTFNLGTLNGAALASNQATEISSLSSIDTKATNLVSKSTVATCNLTLSGDIGCVTNTAGASSMSVIATGSWAGLIAVMCSADGSTFDLLKILDLGSNTAQSFVSTPNTGVANVGGCQTIQMKAITGMSGTANVTVNLSPGSPASSVFSALPGQFLTYAYMKDGAGTALTSTLISAKQSLDVNVANATLPPLSAGTAVIGHVIADTGSTTAVTSLPAIPSGTNVIGHVIADTGSTTAVTALPSIPAGAAIVGKVGIDQTTPGTTNLVALAANQSVNEAQINGVTPLMGNGATGTGSQRVTIASDNTAFAVNATLQASSAVVGHVIADTGSTTAVTALPAIPAGTNLMGKVGIDQTTPGTTNGVQVNAALPAGTNVIGHIIADTGSTTAVTALPAIPVGSNVIGKVSIDQTTPGTTNLVALAANQSVNVAQINATTPLMGNGTTGTGSQRVTIASDNTAFAVNATLQASSAVVGHVIVDTAPTTAVSQSGNWNLQYNAVNSAASQTTGNVSTVITLTAPSNAIGFILEAKDANTANMRYVIGGGIATTSSGLQLQPGRDTGYVPAGANISIVAESGTQEYQVQWVATH